MTVTIPRAPESKHGDAFIPGLAALDPSLGRVPGCNPDDPHFRDPEAAWRTDWFDWRKRIAPVVYDINRHAAADPEFRALELAQCAKDPAYWLTVYGWIYEPRPRAGEDPDKPYFPMAFQVHLLNWFLHHAAQPDKYDGFVSKSRGLGASWIFCAGAVWAWLHTAWELHFISFKEEAVYRRNDRSSLFGKIEYILGNLPGWMMPEGFTDERDHLRLNIFNPRTGAAITGESTTTRATRSKRKTAIIYDEGAFIENFSTTWATGAGTSDSRFGISTESYDEGDDWEVEWLAAKNDLPESVWELEWWENPYQDQKWFEAEKFRHRARPHFFAMEYLRDAEAAQTTLMYPTAKHLPRTMEHYDPTRSMFVSIDPGRADDTAIAWGQEIHKEGRKGIRWLGSYKRHLVPVDFYAHLLTGIPPEDTDECWPMWVNGEFTDRDKFLMGWFKSRPSWVSYVMDPAGKAQHTNTGMSFFDIMYRKSAELRRREWERGGRKGEKPKGLPILAELVEGAGNLIDNRRNCTRLYLPATEFSEADPDLWRAGEIQEALRRSKFSEGTPKSVSEPKPIHDDWSHLRTTVEYASVAIFFGWVRPPKNKINRMLDDAARAVWKAA
jgi:hypothetical protein